jgi:hypothetical protein
MTLLHRASLALMIWGLYGIIISVSDLVDVISVGMLILGTSSFLLTSDTEE